MFSSSRPPSRVGEGGAPASGRDRLVELVGRVVVDDPDLDRRGGAVVRDALRLEELPDARGLGLSQAHVRGRRGGDGPRIRPPVAVKHRERPKVLGRVAHPRLDDVAERAQVGPAVRVHDALRPPRRPRRVVDGDRLFLVFEDVRDGLGRTLRQILLVGVPDLPGVVDADLLDVHVVQQVLQLRVGEDHLRPGMLDDVRHLVLAQPGVYGDEHEPGRRYAEVRLQHRRRVRAEEGHAVALLEPRVAQPRGEAVHALLQLPVRVAPVAVDDRLLLREHVRAAPQKADGRKLAAVDLLGHAAPFGSSPRTAV